MIWLLLMLACSCGLYAQQEHKQVPTRAHLSVAPLREKVTQALKEWGIYDTPEYNSMYRSIIDREQRFVLDGTYYVLYHAYDKAWRVPQDLYKLLYMSLFLHPVIFFIYSRGITW